MVSLEYGAKGAKPLLEGNKQRPAKAAAAAEGGTERRGPAAAGAPVSPAGTVGWAA